MRSRVRPLAFSIGEHEVILLTSEANVLIAAGDRLHSELIKQMTQVGATAGVTLEEANTLDSLLERLATESATTADPAVRIATEEERLVLRRILAELKGYQRGDLTRGLHELRLALDEGS
jgi:hypothetical protein